MMKALRSTRLMWLKAWLFLAIGIAGATLLLLDSPGWRTATLMGCAIWGFCRAYYFAFYVVQHYVQPDFRYSGLLSFAARYVQRRGSGSSQTRHGQH